MLTNVAEARPPETPNAEPADSGERAIATYVLAVVMPLWIASGHIDYWLHRRAKIEENAGTFESTLHAVGISMSALPVLGGLYLEVNAGVLLAMIAGYVAHAGMTIWDVAYADTRRDIVPFEQHVHGMLELLPFCALSFMLVAYRDEALAIVGRGGATRARFAPRWKRKPLPNAAGIATIVAFAAFVAVPYAEELLRCLRYEAPSAPDART
jgi:hypothetical protein